MNMDFGASKTPVEVIKEGTFGGTYFRDIYSVVNGKWYRRPWKRVSWIKEYWSKLLLFKLLWC